jgi:hypothetical protein
VAILYPLVPNFFRKRVWRNGSQSRGGNVVKYCRENGARKWIIPGLFPATGHYGFILPLYFLVGRGGPDWLPAPITVVYLAGLVSRHAILGADM